METFDDSASTELDVRSTSAPIDFVLHVAGGPSRGRDVTVAHSAPGPVHVGQSGTCELRLDDRAVSRRHASFEARDGRLRVVDLRSTNGTFVNGIAVESALLRGGETVRVGASEIFVEARHGSGEVLPGAARFGATIGSSPSMQRLYRLCERLAASDVPVLIEGETGTGKEALAESIHARSARANGPFVVLDCTAVPASLFEAELLGHEKGAFTGAAATRKGCVELAHGGTLLIDEIGDLDLALQAKLLRVVETQSVRRVGGDRAIRFDVRILCATRRDLDREVQAGRFRDDLYHRLAVSRIELPSLARRTGDVRLLAEHFWAELGGARGGPPPEVLRRWEDHAWPGNVRELRNAVSRQIALGDLADEMRSGRAPAPADASDGLDALVRELVKQKSSLGDARAAVVRTFERAYVDALLAEHGGDLDRVAAAAGVGRRYLNMVRARVRR